MISSRFRIVAFFFLFCAFALVLSTPTPKDLTLYKRSTGSDVLAILTTVQLSTNSVLPKIGMSTFLSLLSQSLRWIDALVAAGQVSDSTVRPLLSQLASTASTAIKSVSSLQHPITFPSGGASQADIVSLAGQILSVCDSFNLTLIATAWFLHFVSRVSDRPAWDLFWSFLTSCLQPCLLLLLYFRSEFFMDGLTCTRLTVLWQAWPVLSFTYQAFLS
jgi:hypothetical protein